MIIEKSPLTPQQYEILHGGGAEASEIARELSKERGRYICTAIFIHRNLPLYNTRAFLCTDIVHLNQLFPARSNDKNVAVYLQNTLLCNDILFIV